MKTVSKLIAFTLILFANLWAAPAFAQSAPTLSCRVNGNAEHVGFCTSSLAASFYSVANVLDTGPGNFAIQWNVSGCPNNSKVCVYGVGATQAENQYTTVAWVTNLDSGVTSTVSAVFFSQATCYQPPIEQRRGYWFYC
jgi:hypothetical protein